jgi:chemotaxis protein MotA
MLTLILGSLLSFGVLVFTFMHSKAKLSVYLNPEGFVIVIGGTLAILLMMTKKDELKLLFKHFKQQVFKKARTKKVKDILIEVTNELEKGRIPNQTGHPFIDRCLSWLQAGLKGKELEKLLVDGAKIEIERIHSSAGVLTNLAKYPPALGMVGTVFGIIAIFNGLGTADGQKSIGMNLALAMTATLYGLIMSNFVVSPAAELLSQMALEEELEYSMIVETVKLWSEKETAFFIKEHIELFDKAA